MLGMNHRNKQQSFKVGPVVKIDLWELIISLNSILHMDAPSLFHLQIPFNQESGFNGLLKSSMLMVVQPSSLIDQQLLLTFMPLQSKQFQSIMVPSMYYSQLMMPRMPLLDKVLVLLKYKLLFKQHSIPIHLAQVLLFLILMLEHRVLQLQTITESSTIQTLQTTQILAPLLTKVLLTKAHKEQRRKELQQLHQPIIKAIQTLLQALPQVPLLIVQMEAKRNF